MKKKMVIMLLVLGTVFGSFADTIPQKKTETEGIMAYCTIADLQDAYGADRIGGWSRCDPATVDRAIRNAEAEIDGYLLSGGYAVPISGPPETIRKYCIDIASANLVISGGMIEIDTGGTGVVEQSKVARRYLEKVAEGKFRIPGYINDTEPTAKPPAGAVRVSAKPRIDWRGY
jgi:phage gp36-like protein